MSLIQPHGVDPFAPTCSLICCMLYNDFSSILIPQNNIGYDSCFFFGGGVLHVKGQPWVRVTHYFVVVIPPFFAAFMMFHAFSRKSNHSPKKNKIYAMLICQEHSCAPHF